MNRISLILGVAASAAAGTALAQGVQLQRPALINPKLAIKANLIRRFPSTIPQTIRAQVKTPPVSNWQINPNAFKLAPHVVAAKIAGNINQRFATKSVGYSVTVILPGGASAEANGGTARRTPDGAGRGWTGNDRISIASVSKTFTAAAIIKAMAAKNLSIDMPAFGLLPAGWTYSPSFKTITVREMLAHNSGIRGCYIDLDSLKSCAASAVYAADKNPAISIWDKYNNTNYAFLRLILSRVHDGSIPMTSAQQGNRYVFLVNMLVMGPSGVGGSTCSPPAVNPALSYISTTDDGVWNSNAPQNYNWAAVKPGQPWGDMTEVCGSQGWNLSSRQLATFASALMASNKLLPMMTVDTMRKQGLGLMYFDFGGGLTAFGHGGYHPAPNNDGEINTLILTFNNGVSIGMVINSRYKGNFGQEIAEAIRANIG